MRDSGGSWHQPPFHYRNFFYLSRNWKKKKKTNCLCHIINQENFPIESLVRGLDCSWELRVLNADCWNAIMNTTAHTSTNVVLCLEFSILCRTEEPFLVQGTVTLSQNHYLHYSFTSPTQSLTFDHWHFLPPPAHSFAIRPQRQPHSHNLVESMWSCFLSFSCL